MPGLLVLAIRGSAIITEIVWNLTPPYLCTKPGLSIRDFVIHIHNILEPNTRE